jgi:hypothetical protein
MASGLSVTEISTLETSSSSSQPPVTRIQRPTPHPPSPCPKSSSPTSAAQNTHPTPTPPNDGLPFTANHDIAYLFRSLSTLLTSLPQTRNISFSKKLMSLVDSLTDENNDVCSLESLYKIILPLAIKERYKKNMGVGFVRPAIPQRLEPFKEVVRSKTTGGFYRVQTLRQPWE